MINTFPYLKFMSEHPITRDDLRELKDDIREQIDPITKNVQQMSNDITQLKIGFALINERMSVKQTATKQTTFWTTKKITAIGTVLIGLFGVLGYVSFNVERVPPQEVPASALIHVPKQK